MFTRFGSKLGVLEALSLRCAGRPEMRALREAQHVEDPVAAVEALLTAGCDLWEKEGYTMVQLKAIVGSSPTPAPSSRSSTTTAPRHGSPCTRAGERGTLREGWTVASAAAALHALTSVETFTLLRRDHGLPLAKVMQTILEFSRVIVDEQA